MDALFLAGRLLFASCFLLLGGAMLRSDRPADAPYEDGQWRVAEALAGGALGAGGILIALGALADLGAVLVAGATMAITAVRHRFWVVEPAHRQTSFNHLIKNLALIGAAMMVFFTYNQLQGSAPLSLTDPLIGRL